MSSGDGSSECTPGESFCHDETQEEADVERMIEQAIREYAEEKTDPLERMEQIAVAVSLCKEKLREPSELTQEMRKVMVDKLVQLGLERQILEDPSFCVQEEMCRSNGHEFVLQSARGRNPCCEVCMGTIWRLIQSWRRCRVCGLRAHDRCAAEVKRECVAVSGLAKGFQYDMMICDEKGLADQDYKCYECAAPLAFESAALLEPRLCSLTGHYFCPSCHWNDMWPIPSRLIHNMDPTHHPVSRAAKQLLAVTHQKPLINMSQLNPLMFKYHSGLKKVQKMRRDFLIMKCYFVSCRNARSLRILQYLRDHQHFVEDAEMYTLDEIKEIACGRLVRELEDIHTVFRRHIEDECETCRGNGFFCELCDTANGRNQIIYPFSDGVSMCKTCLYVFHSSCFERGQKVCPRCERRKKRENYN